jgi:hypothetical protein
VAIAVVAAVAALGHLQVGQASKAQGLAARWGRRIAALLSDGVQESLALLRARDPLVFTGCVGSRLSDHD